MELDAIGEAIGLEGLPGQLENRPAVDSDHLGSARLESEQAQQAGTAPQVDDQVIRSDHIL